MEISSQTDQFLTLMDQEMALALGCTEPIAVVFTAAVTRAHAPGNVRKVRCRASSFIIKNAAAVTIPGTHGRCGLKLACALGIAKPESELKLEILSGLTEEQLEYALNLLDSVEFEVLVSDEDDALFIEVEIQTDHCTARSITKHAHTQTILIEVDGQEIWNTDTSSFSGSQEDPLYENLNLKTILEFAQAVPLERLSTIEQSIKTNWALSEEGLKNGYGLQVGKTLSESIDKLMLSSDLATYAMMLTSAGSDARMAGVELPAYSNSGSGNQGITATLPVVAAAYKMGSDHEKMVRACAISNLVTIFIKHKLGKLSSLCGAIIAATGASCGIVHLFGGELPETVSAVKNMLGNLAGMFCDGAKASCALKVSTCVNAAVQAALLSMNKHYIHGTDGIVGNTADQTVSNYCRVIHEGIPDLDKIILDIIVSKKKEGT